MTTASFRELDYTVEQRPDGWAADIESDLVRLFGYASKETLLQAVKGSIASLDRHDLRKHDEQSDIEVKD
jgi:hypothetical protein